MSHVFEHLLMSVEDYWKDSINCPCHGMTRFGASMNGSLHHAKCKHFIATSELQYMNYLLHCEIARNKQLESEMKILKEEIEEDSEKTKRSIISSVNKVASLITQRDFYKRMAKCPYPHTNDIAIRVCDKCGWSNAYLDTDVIEPPPIPEVN